MKTPAKAARTARTVKPAVKPAAVVAEPIDATSDVETDAPIGGDAPIATAPVIKPLPIPASALLVQYQRVGRELMLLSKERAAQVGIENHDAKLSCAELQALFRSIKIDDAVKTPEARVAAAAVLAELHAKVERLRGVAVSQDCLNNPLAKECT